MKSLVKWMMLGIASFFFGVIVGDQTTHHYFMEIRDFVESISAVIWAVLISACASIYGVQASNKSSFERLREQHIKDTQESREQRIHDAKQKEGERKATLRREVYLEGVEQAHAILAAIGGMIHRPLDDLQNDVVELHSFLRANSKIWLVADSEAAILTRVLVKRVFMLLLGAQNASMPYRVAAKQLHSIELELQFAESEVKRIEAWITSINEHGDRGSERLNASHGLLSAHDAVTRGYKKRDNQQNEMRPLQIAFVRFIHNEMWPAQETLVNMVSALRLELGLESGLVQFVTHMKEAKAEIEQMLNFLERK